jgi:apolipoprotein N-acyltransferase
MKTSDALLFSLTTGALLSITHGYIPYLGMVAIIPLMLVLRRATPRQAFYGGLGCGMLESVILMGTLHYHWHLYVALCLFYGLERAVFSLLYVSLSRKSAVLLRTLLAPALWVVLELGHAWLPGTLPNLLGDTQHTGVFLGLARVGGTFLICFVLVWLNACAAEWLACRFEGRDDREARRAGLVFACALGLVGGVAWWSAPVDSGSHRVATLVQGGFPRWVNRHARVQEDWADVPLTIYTKLSGGAARSDLTIWPEAAVWKYWGADTNYEGHLRQLATERGALLAGVLRKDDGATEFNSSLFLEGDSAQFGDKQRLVWREELAYAEGLAPTTFEASFGKGGAVFCLEAVMPGYTRRLAEEGAEFLVVLASGSDLAHTPVARIHAQRSIVRAVETGRAVLHAGHHGYSMAISPRGDATPMAPPFKSAVIEAPFELQTTQTLYIRWGDRPLLCLAGLLIGLGAIRRVFA